MARHRNVRSMNYSDEYDGYDDVYGHSVEDEYCISPSDEAQFMYDRTRQPQISAFLIEQDNITEEDENVNQSNDRKNSDCYIPPTLNDLDEAKLRSCLEEIRNVIGDSISERIVVETVIKSNFDVNKALDNILSNATSTGEPTSDTPKPQRTRKDRDRDFINFQSNLVNLVGNREVKTLPESFHSLQDHLCQDIVICDENTQHNEDMNCKLIMQQSYVEDECLGSRTVNRNLISNYHGSVISRNIPNSLQWYDGMGDSDCSRGCYSNLEISNSVQIITNGNSHLRVSNNLERVCREIPLVEETPTVMDHKNSECNSSDEDLRPSPLAALARQLESRGSLERQNHAPDDNCLALENLTLQESGKQALADADLESEALREQPQDAFSPNIDDSDDEEKSFSPLVALASKHLQHKASESCFSQEKELQSLDPKRNPFLITKDKVGEKCPNEATELSSSTAASEDNEKLPFTGVSAADLLLLEKSSDDEESAFSPLAALADKFKKGQGDRALSPVQRECGVGHVTQGLLRSKSSSESDKSAAHFLPVSTLVDPITGGFWPDNQSAERSTQLHVNEQASGSSLQCYSPSGSKVAGEGGRSKELNSTQNKAASSLSDLAFFHLTRSASYGVNADLEMSDKKFHSESNISKCVPGGFVIPFLKQEENSLSLSRKDSLEMESEAGSREEGASDASVDSTDEWVIDLSSAIREPGLIPPRSFSEKTPTKIIHVHSEVEMQEDPPAALADAPCELDARAMLKMKFSYSKRRCSAFGDVLCHSWRELARPYVPPSEHNAGTVVRFSFSTESPDDKILLFLNRKK